MRANEDRSANQEHPRRTARPPGGALPFALAFTLLAFAPITWAAPEAATTNAAVDPLQLERVLGMPGTWGMTPADVEHEWRVLGFSWSDPVGPRRGARSVRAGMKFLQTRTEEILLEFTSNRLSGATLLMYSRGAPDELAPEAFEQLVGGLQGRITGWLRANGRSQRDETLGVGAVERLIWTNASSRIDLEWSYARTAGPAPEPPGEYVRVKLAPYAADQAAMMAAGRTRTPPADPVTVLDLRSRVTRTDDGDAKIRNLPMVIQGDRNFCVAATIERLLRYYGCIVDQHELGRLAGTDARMGTDWPTMIEALHRIGPPLGLRTESLYEITPAALENIVQNYNKLAGEAKKPLLNAETAKGIGDLYQTADYGLLKASRVQKGQDRDKFFEQVTRQIDAGVPMLWTLIAGKIPEPGMPRGAFGHMRVIMGYNTKTKEIIYSDTWGAQHAEKRMTLDDAWTVSLGLHALMPRNVRY